MARGKRMAEAATTSMDETAAETTPLDTWYEQQRDLFATTLGQWTFGQQELMGAWYRWLDGLSSLAAPWPLAAWPALPEELLLAGPRLMQIWWAPWAPMVERGQEQLA